MVTPSSLYQSSSDPVRSVIGEGSKSRNENSKTPNLDNNKSYSPKAVETGLLEISSVKCIFWDRTVLLQVGVSSASLSPSNLSLQTVKCVVYC